MNNTPVGQWLYENSGDPRFRFRPPGAIAPFGSGQTEASRSCRSRSLDPAQGRFMIRSGSGSLLWAFQADVFGTHVASVARLARSDALARGLDRTKRTSLGRIRVRRNGCPRSTNPARIIDFVRPTVILANNGLFLNAMGHQSLVWFPAPQSVYQDPRKYHEVQGNDSWAYHP